MMKNTFPHSGGPSATPSTITGTCFCGAVSIEVFGTPTEMGYCHCASCRAYSGAPLVAFTLWRSEQVTVTRGAQFLGAFNKTGMSNRRFCTRCGGHIMAEHPDLGMTDVSAAVLPGLRFEPVVHLNYVCAVIPMRDGLPKLRDFPAAVGGSGELVGEDAVAATWGATTSCPRPASLERASNQP
jgi:hypothetical protein